MKFKNPEKRSVLSFDIGKKRIGLAYCDPLLITISILPAVIRSRNLEEINIFKKHINNHKIKGLIFGLPLDDKGLITDQAEDCINYGEMISRILGLPYNFVNEHSTTWESKNRYGVTNDKSGLIDSLSAKIILEQWMKEGPELKEFVFNNYN